MPKSLVIVESPTKARTLTKFLGRKYMVLSSMGHVKDLPKSKLGVDIESGFHPHFITIRGKGKTLERLRTSAKSADQIYLACDPDREGEAIAYDIATEVNGDKAIHRILLYEITPSSVSKALDNPGSIDHNKVEAQRTRRILDRLVGYKVSPFLWKTVRRGLSAGRVQTVALRLICQREEEIRSFVPEEYWTIVARLATSDGETFDAKLTAISGKKTKITNGEDARKISDDLKRETYEVESVKRTQKTRTPPPPFITATLQQYASRRLRFSPRRTMALAQQLFEGIELEGGERVGLITYMRTDSVRIATEAIEETRKYIEDTFEDEYLPKKPRRYRSRSTTQGAHEAIRPTSVVRTPDRVKPFLQSDQYKLYKLIWSRFVSCQMSNATYNTVTATIAAGEYTLKAHGSRLTFPGFLAVSPELAGQDRFLPVLKEGDILRLLEIASEQHFTEPPAPYTEATLIRELESKGIGRPSTYAPIVETIQDRSYVIKENGKLVPTELGMITISILIPRFESLFDIDFTASMEAALDKIESGESSRITVLNDFYQPFEEQLRKAEQETEQIRSSIQQKTGQLCDKCGKPMVVKWGRYGKFLACSGYPECKNTKPLEESPPQGTCPECGGALLLKEGRYGRFIACSNYPACSYTKPVGIGVPCPEEGCDGELVERRSKKGKVFYSCSNYPSCRNAYWNRPVDRTCRACGFPVMLEKKRRRGDLVLSCPACRAIETQEGESSK